MVKQGKHAGVSQTKKLRNLKRRFTQTGRSQVIEDNKLTEFVLVRWHLVSGKQSELVTETMQRFLETWLEKALQQNEQDKSANWVISQITKISLQQFNQQVSWQFYAVLNQHYAELQHFLLKELPAVPLKASVQVVEPLSAEDWRQQLSQQLAVNSMLMLFHDNQSQLEKITQQQIQTLSASFQTNQEMNWQQVAQIFEPLKTPDTELADSETRKWQHALAKLTINQL